MCYLVALTTHPADVVQQICGLTWRQIQNLNINLELNLSLLLQGSSEPADVLTTALLLPLFITGPHPMADLIVTE